MERSLCESELLPPGYRARCGRWRESGGEPVLEATGQVRLVPDLVSVWVNLATPTKAVVAGAAEPPGIAELPPGLDLLSCYGAVLATARRPCPDCGSALLLLLGQRGGGRIAARVHRDLEPASLIPYHLAERLPSPPAAGVARPAGLVFGKVAGALGVPVEVARLLWAGQDGRPLGWSRLPRRLPDAGVRFERAPGLAEAQRWLFVEGGRELLTARLAEDLEAVAVRRLHRAEGVALEELGVI